MKLFLSFYSSFCIYFYPPQDLRHFLLSRVQLLSLLGVPSSSTSQHMGMFIQLSSELAQFTSPLLYRLQHQLLYHRLTVGELQVGSSALLPLCVLSVGSCPVTSLLLLPLLKLFSNTGFIEVQFESASFLSVSLIVFLSPSMPEASGLPAWFSCLIFHLFIDAPSPQAQAPAIDWLGCLRAAFHPLTVRESDVVYLHNLPYITHMSKIIRKWWFTKDFSHRYCAEVAWLLYICMVHPIRMLIEILNKMLNYVSVYVQKNIGL